MHGSEMLFISDQVQTDNIFMSYHFLVIKHFTKQISILQVELGPGGNELPENTAKEDKERRALDKRKYLALSRRCKELEQVCLSLFINKRDILTDKQPKAPNQLLKGGLTLPFMKIILKKKSSS